MRHLTGTQTAVYMAVIVVLAVGLAVWFRALVRGGYVALEEGMSMLTTGYAGEGADTSRTIDPPITTPYACSNMCGPSKRCALTGTECFSDLDCSCSVPVPNASSAASFPSPRGENDAGKLQWMVTPQWSVLTTDMGTQAAFYNSKARFTRPPQADFGPNQWTNNFKQQQDMYNAIYAPPNDTPGMLHYPPRWTETGAMITDGPLAANAYLGNAAQK